MIEGWTKDSTLGTAQNGLNSSLVCEERTEIVFNYTICRANDGLGSSSDMGWIDP
jgi:hypothetical protein